MPPRDPTDGPDPPEMESADPGDDGNEAARAALARARKAARAKGLRPGMRPLRRSRTVPGSRQSGSSRPSGARPDGRDPSLLSDEITRLVDDRGWQADVRVGSVLGKWATIVGPEVADHVVPVSFDGSTLRVRADSTAWATQMRLLTSVVLGRIDEAAGAGVVTELIVDGPAAPSWARGRRRVAGRGPRDTYG